MQITTRSLDRWAVNINLYMHLMDINKLFTRLSLRYVMVTCLTHGGKNGGEKRLGEGRVRVQEGTEARRVEIVGHLCNESVL